MNQTQMAQVHFSRAIACFQSACFTQAVRHYLDGLKIDGTRAEVHADLSKSYEMLGQWDEALACLEASLKLHANHPVALRRKKRILEEKQVYEALIHEETLGQPIHSDVRAQHSCAPGLTRTKIAREHFALTCEDSIPSKTLWLLCQLIEKTYCDVGKLLQCYPQHEVSISIENRELRNRPHVHRQKPADPDTKSPLPIWAAGAYHGHIRLTCNASTDPNLGLLYALIRHEWVHLLIDRLAHGQCPIWLNEGLAQLIARPIMNFERQRLQQANHNQQLLCVHELEQVFRDSPSDRQRVSYLQSTAIAERLIQQFGISRMRDLLTCIGIGVSAQAAFQKIFGKTDEEIVESWKGTISRGETRYRNHRGRDIGRPEVFSRWLYA